MMSRTSFSFFRLEYFQRRDHRKILTRSPETFVRPQRSIMLRIYHGEENFAAGKSELARAVRWTGRRFVRLNNCSVLQTRAPFRFFSRHSLYPPCLWVAFSRERSIIHSAMFYGGVFLPDDMIYPQLFASIFFYQFSLHHIHIHNISRDAYYLIKIVILLLFNVQKFK